MRLFGSVKLTDKIRIGASTGGSSKKNKGIGCGSIFLILCLICIPISLVKSCVGGDDEKTTEPTTIETSAEETTETKGIFFDDMSNVEVKAGESIDGSLNNKSGDAYGKLVFVSSDEDIATIELDYGMMTTVNYTIKGISPGTATIHVENSDGTIVSEKIVVTVLEPETTTEKETTTEEKDTAAPVAAQTETTTKKPTTTSQPVAEKREYVLNTNTMKIHNPGCSSVKNIKPENYATTKDFDGSIADGYEPCGRCHPSGD